MGNEKSNAIGNQIGNTIGTTVQISDADIKGRLESQSPTALARRWGCDPGFISRVLRGRHPQAQIMGRLARQLKVPETRLRTYFLSLPKPTEPPHRPHTTQSTH